MVILAVLLAFLLFPTTVAAQVIVNEIYPNPETVEQEWVELWNGGSSEISLSGWELWDQQSSPSLLHQFNNTIAADEFFVITLQSVLNNSGDSVILKDSNGVEIDRLDYSSSTKGKSWSRNPDNLGEVVLTAPTQGTTNSIPTPSPTPVINNSPPPALSEVMACPDSGNEWIELFNPHHQTVNLAGFALHDNKSQVALLENETLGSQKYLTIELTNVLNNGGDSVNLISPDHEILESFTYESCDSGLSWLKRNNNWEQTSLPTKGSANIFNEQAELIDSPVASAAGVVDQRPASDDFLYPPTVLKPKLDYRFDPFPAAHNIVFHDPPKLEKGATSVIMGSIFLLIPGWLYVKEKQQHF